MAALPTHSSAGRFRRLLSEQAAVREVIRTPVPSWLYIPAAVLISALATGYYWRFSRVWTDDALIYFRIADHVRQGLGPVLNAGDLHGAGTSLIWVYLLAGWQNSSAATTW